MTSERSPGIGYMTLIAGLLDILEDVNGVEVTEEIMCMNGKRRGEHIGKKLGANKDPQTAIREFLEYIKPYYEIEIKNEKPTKNGYTSDIEVKNCLIKNLCKNRGLSIKNPLCKSTHGFIEGALSFMTGMQVDVNTPIAGWDICQSTVEFKQKRDRFHFL